MEECDLLIGCGITTPLATLSHRDIPEIIEAVALHTTVLSIKAELDQLILGLQDAGVLESVRTYPELFKPMFVYTARQLSSGQCTQYMF